jgi:predicted transcriptional regulator
MTRDVVTVRRDLSMRELGRLFETTDYNGYPVEEDSQVIGFVTKFDYLACFEFTPARMLPQYDDLMKRTVGDVMTADFIYVRSDTKLTRVLQLMVEHRIRSMPVIDSTLQILGIIAREDVIRALEQCAKDEA